jgi:hypothetical protein
LQRPSRSLAGVDGVLSAGDDEFKHDSVRLQDQPQVLSTVPAKAEEQTTIAIVGRASFSVRLNIIVSECYYPTVQTEQIVALLIAERDRLEAAIQALQGTTKPVGRPPRATVPAVQAAVPVARKRKMSAAGRKAIAEAARRRWAAIKVAKAPSPPTVEPKRTISSVARKAIADGAKKRWVAIKAGKAANPFAKANRKNAAKP